MNDYKLSLDKQKYLMIGAIKNYSKSLQEIHCYKGIRELRALLKSFSDSLRSAKKHRKEKA